MTTLDYILKTKPNRRVITTSPDASVAHAVDEMCTARVGAIVVVDDDARPLGILSENDLMCRLLLKRRDPIITRVAEVMTRDIACVHRDTTPEAALGVMTMRRFRHLPVVDGEHVVGIVSLGDLARWSSGSNVAPVSPLTDYKMAPGHVHAWESHRRLTPSARTSGELDAIPRAKRR